MKSLLILAGIGVFGASLAAQITIKEKVGAVKKSGVVVPPYSVSLYRLEID